MTEELAGRSAVITGGSSNIGFAIAERFLRAGAHITINALDDELLADAAASLQAIAGERVTVVPGDILEPTTRDRLVDAALEAGGGVDVVVNDVLIDGGTNRLTLLDSPRRDWDRLIEGYLHAPLQLVRGARASMVERGHGCVINLVTGAAFTPIAGMGTYGVTKAMMWALTRHLAAELAPHIRVNAVCPGTTSRDGTLKVEGMAPLIARVPMKRMGRAAETAEAALFLASDAASYTTGQLLFCDGGRTELAAPS